MSEDLPYTHRVPRPSKYTPEELEYLRNKEYTLAELEEIRDRIKTSAARFPEIAKEGKLSDNSQTNQKE